MKTSTLLVGAALGVSTVLAHGDHGHIGASELGRRHAVSKRCATQAGAMNRRRALQHTEKRTLAARDSVNINFDDPKYADIQNETCVLTPDVTTGPYIWHRSDLLRQDMTEDQVGVPLYLDIGVLNTNDCSPLSDVLVDVWHCNATGSYSSFTGLNPNTAFPTLLQEMNITDPSNIDLHTDSTTWLRSLWPTDSEGVAEFKSIFPGFYIQRAIHIHAQVHTNWSLAANGSVSTSHVANTGQLFFDEDLSEQIMALEPYVGHTQINRTTNVEDTIYPESFSDGYYPVMSVVPLDGEDVANGVIAYITVGVDPDSTSAQSST